LVESHELRPASINNADVVARAAPASMSVACHGACCGQRARHSADNALLVAGCGDV
jgi:hypothetical protein